MTIMEKFQPTDKEREAIRCPKLVHGLAVAVKNGLDYFVDKLAEPFDADQNASKPKKRPNYELGEWLGRFRDV